MMLSVNVLTKFLKISLSLAGLLFQLSEATWRVDRIYTPIDCSSAGDRFISSDLPSFDVLRRFPFDDGQSSANYNNITGSRNSLEAFRLKQQGEFTLQTSEIFPTGLPDQFSFGSIFRMPQQQASAGDQRSWTLFRVNDLDGRPQFALAFMPEDSSFKVYSARDSKQAIVLSFNSSSGFDASEWNKVHFSFEPNYVSAYVNCQQIGNVSFSSQSQIDQNGDVYLAKFDDDFSTVPLDIQWMAINCDPVWPVYDTCNEVKEEVRIETRTEIVKECCAPDVALIRRLIIEILEENIDRFRGAKGNAGQPGIPGRDGRPGADGKQGAPGMSGRPGMPGRDGERGERGQAGPPGYPGSPGTVGSVEVSENCVGAPGVPGLPGQPGIPGLKGDRGDSIIGPRGNPGPEGARGPEGSQGPQGVCEMCRLFSVENLQTLISQSVRQTKGPVGR